MRNQGLWHVNDQIFGYLDHGTLEICRKVSIFWNESLEPMERISLFKILDKFSDIISEYHGPRPRTQGTEDKVLKMISGWSRAVKKYGANASIEDLRAVKSFIFKTLLEENSDYFSQMLKGHKHPLEFVFYQACRDGHSDDWFDFRWTTCNHGRTETVKLILSFSQENVDAIDLNTEFLNRSRYSGYFHGTAYHMACRCGQTEIVKLIHDFSRENNSVDLNARDSEGMTGFHQACWNGQTETVKKILQFSQENNAINLNATDNEGRTGFNWACNYSQTKTVELILDFSQENNAIDLNARDGQGMTAFHRACWKRKTETVKMILQFSQENNAINLNATDNKGRTCFLLACAYGRTETVKLILDSSKENDAIDLSAIDNEGRTGFHLACGTIYPETVKLILDFSKENDAIDLNAIDDQGRTGFHLVCKNGSCYNSTEAVKLILDFSLESNAIDLNARDRQGETGFHLACDFSELLTRPESAKLILKNWKQYGIDIKTTNNDGSTALDILQKYCHPEMDVKTMLEEEYSKIETSERESVNF